MLRHLYRVAICLHPPAFRTRFGEEMLSIFDSTQTKSARFGLLCDCLVSSLRQWILRPDLQAESSHAVLAVDHIPSFSSLEGFRPSTSAMIDGVLLSAVLFVVTCFAIRYSWIRVLNVQIPEYQVDSYLGVHAASPSELRGQHTSEPKRSRNIDDQSGLISPHLQVDVMPVEAASSILSSDVPRASSEPTPGQPTIVAHEMTLQLPLEAYAGTYKSRSPRMTIKIIVKDSQLSMHIAGESPRTLSAISETEFAIAGAGDSRIEFLPAQNGDIVRLRLSRDGQQITAERQ